MVRERSIELIERRRVPLDGYALGYGAMLPFPALLAAYLLTEGLTRTAAGMALQIWGGAILIFLAGVRRGLSFRTEGGPRLVQLAMTVWLFLAGLVATIAAPPVAALLLTAGYGSLMALDPVAARRGEAPLYFARLRPAQMAIPVACFAALAATLVLSPA